MNKNEFQNGCRYHMASDGLNYYEFRGKGIAVFCYIPGDGVQTDSGNIEVFQIAKVIGGALTFIPVQITIKIAPFDFIDYDPDDLTGYYEAIRQAVLKAVL